MNLILDGEKKNKQNKAQQNLTLGEWLDWMDLFQL